MRRLIIAFMISFSTVAVMPHSASADGVDANSESQFVSLTNSLRGSLGLPPLSVDPVLTAKARAWASTMSASQNIWHSNLADGVTENWAKLGENVGMGPDVTSINNALVASPHHYANLTDPGFRYVGVGVVSANGTLYVSEVFMELASQPAPSTPNTAAGTPSSPVVRAQAAPAVAKPVSLPAAPPRRAFPVRLSINLEELQALDH